MGEKQIEYVTNRTSSEGLFVENVTVISENAFYDPNNLTNDSGMSGAESYKHLHTNKDPRTTMYRSQVNKAEDLIFVFENMTNVGHMYIWNYNGTDKTTQGIKKFKLAYSSDGINYVNYLDGHQFILQIGSGQDLMPASKIDEQAYFDLGGIVTKYLKLTPLESHGATTFGLSEVRFYHYREVNKMGAKISANIMKFTHSEKISGFNLCNGAALYEPANAESRVSNIAALMFSSSKKQFNFTFNGQYPLGKIVLYNYNDEKNLNRGVKDFELYTSLDGSKFTKINAYTLSKGSGLDKSSPSLIITLDNIQAQYVRLVYKSNYGDSEYGLAALNFFSGVGLCSEIDIALTGKFSSYNGWSGADGIYNTRLNGDQSIGGSGVSYYNFSDTFVGTVNPITKIRGLSQMINNSFAKEENEQIVFYTAEDNLPLTPEKDPARSPNDAFYWLGDAFVSNNTYYVSALYIAKQGALGFEQCGEDLIAFNIIDNEIDFSSKRLIRDANNNKLFYKDTFSKIEIIFGSAFFENTTSAKAIEPDGYIYNFGYRDDRSSFFKRSLVVARFLESDRENLAKYEYFDGNTWQNDISKCAPLDYNGNVSPEMSVTQINNPESKYYKKFIHCYQNNTTSNEVAIRVADSSVGPYSAPLIIYDAPEVLQIKNATLYNAKIHPTLSSKDYLVFSYNVNTSALQGNSENGDLYRPRFLKLYL